MRLFALHGIIIPADFPNPKPEISYIEDRPYKGLESVRHEVILSDVFEKVACSSLSPLLTFAKLLCVQKTENQSKTRQE